MNLNNMQQATKTGVLTKIT